MKTRASMGGKGLEIWAMTCDAVARQVEQTGQPVRPFVVRGEGPAMSYLGWHDPDKKRPTIEKFNDAVDRYIERYGHDPAEVLVSLADGEALADIEWIKVTPVTHVAPNTFFVGDPE